MALSSAKHEGFYTTSGGGAAEISSSKLAELKDLWDKDKANGGNLNLLNDPTLGPLLYQMQQIQDEITYLRTEIDANKDKVSMTLGTSGSTALAGDTNIVTIGSSTTVAFGDMITTTTTVKGKTVTTYTIVMTVTNGGVSKTITHTLT